MFFFSLSTFFTSFVFRYSRDFAIGICQPFAWNACGCWSYRRLSVISHGNHGVWLSAAQTWCQSYHHVESAADDLRCNRHSCKLSDISEYEPFLVCAHVKMEEWHCFFKNELTVRVFCQKVRSVSTWGKIRTERKQLTCAAPRSNCKFVSEIKVIQREHIDAKDKHRSHTLFFIGSNVVTPICGDNRVRSISREGALIAHIRPMEHKHFAADSPGESWDVCVVSHNHWWKSCAAPRHGTALW